MPIGKGNTGSSIVVTCQEVNPWVATLQFRRETARIIDAIWMLVGIDPGLRGTRIVQARHLVHLLDVITASPCSRPATIVLANTYADITRNTSYALGPTQATLSRRHFVIGRALPDIFALEK